MKKVICKLWNVICYTGLWASVIVCVLFIVLFESLERAINKSIVIPLGLCICLAIVSLIPAVIIFTRNVKIKKEGKEIGFTSFLLREDIDENKKITAEKIANKYPAVNSQYLHERPTGIVFGKYDLAYVCYDVDPFNIMHSCIIGSPGSGKSAGPLLCSLIHNFMENEPTLTFFVLDIKPELAQKSVPLYGSSAAKVINPKDSLTAGWNPYYRLTNDTNEDDVVDTITTIAHAIIVGDRTSPAHFVESARKIMIGFLLYFYQKKFSFMASINEIMKYSVQDLISLIINDDEGCTVNSRVYMQLREYYGQDNDAFANIAMYIKKPLEVFGRNDISEFFEKRDSIACPIDLEGRISLFLSIPESELIVMSGIIRMILTQTMDYLQSRPEGRHSIVLMVDEFARIGRMDVIFNALATLRSRNVSIMLVMQDLSQAMIIYSREEARELINLCELKCVLSCADLETCEMLSAYAGKYKEEQISVEENPELISLRDRTVKTIAEKNVLDVSDIMELRRMSEVMLIAEGRYMRFDALRYFEDPILGPRSDEVQKINKRKLIT